MSGNDALMLVLAGAIGLAVGVWWSRRHRTPLPPVYAALHAGSLWNQIPFGTVPGPQATWALI